MVATVTNATATLNTLNFTSAGTYAASDITKFQLWYNTSDDISTATQVGSNITSSLGSGTHSFSGLTQALTVGTRYLWITADIDASAVAGNTINTSTITSTDLSFSQLCNSITGSISAGGAQTIASTAAPDVTLASANPAVCSCICK
jgi:trimeric autotransporter adhesin